MPSPPKRETIPHVRPPTHRTAVIDNAVTTVLDQGSGVRVLFSLTRVEVLSKFDTIETLPNGGFKVIAGDTGQLIQRLFEFTADMAPDQAVMVVNNLLSGLQTLSQTRKAQYGLPDSIAQIALIAPKIV